MEIVFLSPHYDDAVYSCGGTIYQLSQQGYQVTILTLMAGIPTEPLPSTPIVEDNHQRWQSGANPVFARRDEDQTAVGILGAKTQYHDVLDCIYRVVDGEALYPDEDSLWETVHSQDSAIANLREIALDPSAKIYAPLGVGNHVDHLITRDWGLELAQSQGFDVTFYVEYPYLRSREAVQEAYDKMPCQMIPLHQSISDAAMAAKINAMTAYTSQITTFWDDASQIDAEVKRTFTVNGQFIEEFATFAE